MLYIEGHVEELGSGLVSDDILQSELFGTLPSSLLYI